MPTTETGRATIDEIKSKLDIVDVIGKTVSLHHDSNGVYKGAVSSHSKSGASLAVDQRMQCYHDFAGIANPSGGDVFDWIGYENGLDARGKDFPTVLSIAADMAGVEFSNLTNDDIEAVSKRNHVHDTLTTAAGIYHENLTPEIRKYINDKWGITDETIDRLKIGYAKPGNGANIYGKFNDDDLLESGLIVKVFEKTDRFCVVEHFQGRVIFPYWNGGKVVNFAGRGDFNEPVCTPNTKHEKNGEILSKYKKLLVHNDKHEYVSKHVNNGYIWGEDTLHGQTHCIITEGIADAIVLMQHEVPVISPVTTKFAKHDIERLVSIAKRMQTVYICNDNEASGAGEDGAIRTGNLLKREGVDVRIVILPKPDGLDKIDIAEYFLSHNKGDFENVLNSGEDIYTYLLNKIEKSDDTSENIKLANCFIDSVVKYLPSDEADLLINHTIKSKFGFTRDDCRILKAYYSRVKESNGNGKNDDDINEIHIPFDVVAERILERVNLFTFDDTKEIYIYSNGVYVKKGAEATIKQLTNEIYSEIFVEMCESKDITVPNHIPIPQIKYRNEVLEWIRIETRIFRDEIDKSVEYKHLINMQNGILDITNSTFMKHDPKFKMTRQLPIEYNENAECPQIRKFLYDVVSPQDAEVLLEFLGYSFIPDIRHDQAIMLLGEGSNGKSLWLKIIIAMHGLENICSTSLQRLADDRFAMAELYNKLLNIFPDLGDTTIQSEDAFKGLSSGDLLTAQMKYGQPFQFMNYARQIYSANRLPAIREGTYAYFRRWILINFPHTFSDNPDMSKGEMKKDKELLGKLTTSDELSGLFNLAVACMKHMQLNGKYSYADSVEEVAKKYQTKSDPIRMFTEKYTDTDVENLPKNDLYEAYRKWCSWTDVPVLTSAKFTKRLKGLGFTECRPRDDYGNQTLSWGGVKLTDAYWKDVPQKPEQKKVADFVRDKMFWETYTISEGFPHSTSISNGDNAAETLSSSLSSSLKPAFSLSVDSDTTILSSCFLHPTRGEIELAQGHIDDSARQENLVESRVEKKPTQNHVESDASCGKTCKKTPTQKPTQNCEEFVPTVEGEEEEEKYSNVCNDLSDFSRTKQAIIDHHNTYEEPVFDVRDFVEGFLCAYPEFDRKTTSFIAGMLSQRGWVA